MNNMAQETLWIIATHSSRKPVIEKMEFTSIDEEFVNDPEEWTFIQYVEYYVNEKINELEQGFYKCIVIDDSDRLNIIKELIE